MLDEESVAMRAAHAARRPRFQPSRPFGMAAYDERAKATWTLCSTHGGCRRPFLLAGAPECRRPGGGGAEESHSWEAEGSTGRGLALHSSPPEFVHFVSVRPNRGRTVGPASSPWQSSHTTASAGSTPGQASRGCSPAAIKGKPAGGRAHGSTTRLCPLCPQVTVRPSRGKNGWRHPFRNEQATLRRCRRLSHQRGGWPAPGQASQKMLASGENPLCGWRSDHIVPTPRVSSSLSAPRPDGGGRGALRRLLGPRRGQTRRRSNPRRDRTVMSAGNCSARPWRGVLSGGSWGGAGLSG